MMVLGSIRRKKPEVHDIDIIVQVAPAIDLSCVVLHAFDKVEANGNKIKRGTFRGASVDLYIADDETFDTLVLIRTGSVVHNIKLTALAKSKGLKLHASGKGLTDEKGQVIARTEREIFAALDLPYFEPEERS